MPGSKIDSSGAVTSSRSRRYKGVSQSNLGLDQSIGEVHRPFNHILAITLDHSRDEAVQFIPDPSDLRSNIHAFDTSALAGPFLLSLCLTIGSFMKCRASQGTAFTAAFSAEAAGSFGMVLPVPMMPRAASICGSAFSLGRTKDSPSANVHSVSRDHPSQLHCNQSRLHTLSLDLRHWATTQGRQLASQFLASQPRTLIRAVAPLASEPLLHSSVQQSSGPLLQSSKEAEGKLRSKHSAVALRKAFRGNASGKHLDLTQRSPLHCTLYMPITCSHSTRHSTGDRQTIGGVSPNNRQAIMPFIILIPLLIPFLADSLAGFHHQPRLTFYLYLLSDILCSSGLGHYAKHPLPFPFIPLPFHPFFPFKAPTSMSA